MSDKPNWHITPNGGARITGRYDGPDLIFEASVANELLVTLDGQYRDWGYFNALDVLEAVIDRARVADPTGTAHVLAKQAIGWEAVS